MKSTAPLQTLMQLTGNNVQYPNLMDSIICALLSPCKPSPCFSPGLCKLNANSDALNPESGRLAHAHLCPDITPIL